MKTICRAFLVVSILLTVIPFTNGADAPATLLVVPSRYTIVQLAFDVAKLRPTTLVAYEVEPRHKTMVLHRWDANANDWMRMAQEDYTSGMAYRPVPLRAILVGGDADLPAALTELPSGMDVQRIPTLKVAPMVNALNETLSFTPSEWRWLARRHRLELEDLNAERRRLGKYGRREAHAPPIDSSDVVEPAAIVMPPMKTEPMTIEEKGVPAVSVVTPPVRIATPAAVQKRVPVAPPIHTEPVVIENEGVPAPSAMPAPNAIDSAPVLSEPVWETTEPDVSPEDK